MVILPYPSTLQIFGDKVAMKKNTCQCKVLESFES